VGVLNELVHGERLSREHVFKTACDEAADALGFSAIMAKGMRVEVGLQMLVADAADKRTN